MQSLKAKPLIVVTDSGRFIVVKLVQLEKALPSIVVKVSGNTTDSKLALLLNPVTLVIKQKLIILRT